MKILFATSKINEHGGGIASYAIDFLKEFQDENEFLVISSDDLNDKYSRLAPNYKKLDPESISYFDGINLLRIIHEYKPDLIINSNFKLLSLILPYVKTNILKISISHFIDGKLAIVAGFNHKYYNAIVTLSEAGKRQLNHYYPNINKKKIEVIYNFFRPASSNSHKGEEELDNITKIVFPGGANPHKNPLLVFKVVRKLIKMELKFKFIWLGDTLLPGAKFLGKRYISDQIKKDDRLEFTGTINRELAVKIIRNADIFLLPSKKEGCPITLLEAMSAGTIPIVSDSKHASSEIIRHEYNGFVLSASQVTDYLNLITDIIEKPQYYKEIRNNCYNSFHQFYTAELWKLKMSDLFTSRIDILSDQINYSKSHFYRSRWILQIRLIWVRLIRIFTSLHYAIIFFIYRIAFKSY